MNNIVFGVENGDCDVLTLEVFLLFLIARERNIYCRWRIDLNRIKIDIEFFPVVFVPRVIQGTV